MELGVNHLESLTDEEFITSLNKWRTSPNDITDKNFAIRYLNEAERRWKPCPIDKI